MGRDQNRDIVHRLNRRKDEFIKYHFLQVSSGLIDVKPLITHRFDLEESVKAFETAKTGAGGAIKVMIGCKKE
jgi:threonine dehydrogenase-like Zn-dependent dehydrogenase